MGKKKKGKKKKGTSVGKGAVAVPPRPSSKLTSMTASKTDDLPHPHFGVMRICASRSKSGGREFLKNRAEECWSPSIIIEFLNDSELPEMPYALEGDKPDASGWVWKIAEKIEEKLHVVLTAEEEVLEEFVLFEIEAWKTLPEGGWTVKTKFKYGTDGTEGIYVVVCFSEARPGCSMNRPIMECTWGGPARCCLLVLPGGGSDGDVKVQWSSFAPDGAKKSTTAVTAWHDGGFMCNHVLATCPDASYCWYAHPSSSTIEAEYSSGIFLRSVDNPRLLGDQKLVAHYCMLDEMYAALQNCNELMALLRPSAEEAQLTGGWEGFDLKHFALAGAQLFPWLMHVASVLVEQRSHSTLSVSTLCTALKRDGFLLDGVLCDFCGDSSVDSRALIIHQRCGRRALLGVSDTIARRLDWETCARALVLLDDLRVKSDAELRQVATHMAIEIEAELPRQSIVFRIFHSLYFNCIPLADDLLRNLQEGTFDDELLLLNADGNSKRFASSSESKRLLRHFMPPWKIDAVPCRGKLMNVLCDGLLQWTCNSCVEQPVLIDEHPMPRARQAHAISQALLTQIGCSGLAATLCTSFEEFFSSEAKSPAVNRMLWQLIGKRVTPQLLQQREELAAMLQPLLNGEDADLTEEEVAGAAEERKRIEELYQKAESLGIVHKGAADRASELVRASRCGPEAPPALARIECLVPEARAAGLLDEDGAIAQRVAGATAGAPADLPLDFDDLAARCEGKSTLAVKHELLRLLESEVPAVRSDVVGLIEQCTSALSRTLPMLTGLFVRKSSRGRSDRTKSAGRDCTTALSFMLTFQMLRLRDELKAIHSEWRAFCFGASTSAWSEERSEALLVTVAVLRKWLQRWPRRGTANVINFERAMKEVSKARDDAKERVLDVIEQRRARAEKDAKQRREDKKRREHAAKQNKLEKKRAREEQARAAAAEEKKAREARAQKQREEEAELARVSAEEAARVARAAAEEAEHAARAATEEQMHAARLEADEAKRATLAATEERSAALAKLEAERPALREALFAEFADFLGGYPTLESRRRNPRKGGQNKLQVWLKSCTVAEFETEESIRVAFSSDYDGWLSKAAACRAEHEKKREAARERELAKALKEQHVRDQRLRERDAGAQALSERPPPSFAEAELPSRRMAYSAVSAVDDANFAFVTADPLSPDGWSTYAGGSARELKPLNAHAFAAKLCEDARAEGGASDIFSGATLRMARGFTSKAKTMEMVGAIEADSSLLGSSDFCVAALDTFATFVLEATECPLTDAEVVALQRAYEQVNQAVFASYPEIRVFDLPSVLSAEDSVLTKVRGAADKGRNMACTLVVMAWLNNSASLQRQLSGGDGSSQKYNLSLGPDLTGSTDRLLVAAQRLLRDRATRLKAEGVCVSPEDAALLVSVGKLRLACLRHLVESGVSPASSGARRDESASLQALREASSALRRDASMCHETRRRNDIMAHVELGEATAAAMSAYLQTPSEARTAGTRSVLSFTPMRRRDAHLEMKRADRDGTRAQGELLRWHASAALHFRTASMYFSQCIDDFTGWWCAACGAGHALEADKLATAGAAMQASNEVATTDATELFYFAITLGESVRAVSPARAPGGAAGSGEGLVMQALRAAYDAIEDAPRQSRAPMRGVRRTR